MTNTQQWHLASQADLTKNERTVGNIIHIVVKYLLANTWNVLTIDSILLSTEKQIMPKISSLMCITSQLGKILRPNKNPQHRSSTTNSRESNSL